MSLREPMVEVVAVDICRNRDHSHAFTLLSGCVHCQHVAESAVDEVLDFLTEHADEWGHHGNYLTYGAAARDNISRLIDALKG